MSLKREGRRGRATRPRHPDRPCLNCGDPTPGEYCPTCGQRKVEVQVSVRAMVMDVLEDELVLGKRLPRTLGALLLKPGFLTVEHVNGRIVRYVRPFKLYLVSSILFFLLVSFLSLRLIERAQFGAGPPELEDAAEVTAEADSAAIVAIDSVLADPEVPEAAKAALRATRAPIAERLAAAADTGAAAGGIGGVAAPAPPPVTGPAGTPWLAEIDVNTGVAALDSAIVARARRLSRLEPREVVQTVVGDFLSYVPTVMFILLPIFALVLKLLYIRTGRYYAEHFVFLLHTHAFVYVVFTLMLLLRQWTIPLLQVALFLWIFGYILLAMKRVYGQGWLMTLVKYWVLGWAYVWILALAVPLAFLGTVLLLPG